MGTRTWSRKGVLTAAGRRRLAGGGGTVNTNLTDIGSAPASAPTPLVNAGAVAAKALVDRYANERANGPFVTGVKRIPSATFDGMTDDERNAIRQMIYDEMEYAVDDYVALSAKFIVQGTYLGRERANQLANKRKIDNLNLVLAAIYRSELPKPQPSQKKVDDVINTQSKSALQAYIARAIRSDYKNTPLQELEDRARSVITYNDFQIKGPRFT